MDNKEITTIITKSLITKNDVLVVLQLIAQVKQLLFKKTAKTNLGILKSQTSERFFSIIESVLNSNEPITKIEKQFIELEKMVQNMPIAKITLNYEPTRKQIEEIASKIQEKTSQNVILEYEFKENENLGVQIALQGRLFTKTIKYNT